MLKKKLLRCISSNQSRKISQSMVAIGNQLEEHSAENRREETQERKTEGKKRKRKMNILDTLKGRKVKLQTDLKVAVKLTIEEIKEDSNFIETGESNASNDWYPEGYTDRFFTVKFTNGISKRFNSLSELEIVL